MVNILEDEIISLMKALERPVLATLFESTYRIRVSHLSMVDVDAMPDLLRTLPLDVLDL